MTPRVFVSYPREDGRHVRTFADDLENELRAEDRRPRGAPRPMVFIDTKELEPGQEWRAELASELDTCDYFLIISCPAYFRSEPCAKELGFFEQRLLNAPLSTAGRRKRIIPILWRPTGKMHAVVEQYNFVAPVEPSDDSEGLVEQIRGNRDHGPYATYVTRLARHIMKDFTPEYYTDGESGEVEPADGDEEFDQIDPADGAADSDEAEAMDGDGAAGSGISPLGPLGRTFDSIEPAFNTRISVNERLDSNVVFTLVNAGPLPHDNLAWSRTWHAFPNGTAPTTRLDRLDQYPAFKVEAILRFHNIVPKNWLSPDSSRGSIDGWRRSRLTVVLCQAPVSATHHPKWGWQAAELHPVTCTATGSAGPMALVTVPASAASQIQSGQGTAPLQHGVLLIDNRGVNRRRTYNFNMIDNANRLATALNAMLSGVDRRQVPRGPGGRPGPGIQLRGRP